MYDRKDKAVDHQKRLLVKILRLDSLRMSGGVEDLSEMAQGSSWLRRSSGAQSRQRQKTRGMKAPIATKIGNMDELGRLIFRILHNEQDTL